MKCKAILRNGNTCSFQAKNTVYCGRHIGLCVSKITQIQRWWRQMRWKLLIKRFSASDVVYYSDRKLCHNESDLYTFECITKIPDRYFVCYHDRENHKVWGFDIRTLFMCLRHSLNNPYTTIPFEKKWLDKVYRRINTIKNDPEFYLEQFSFENDPERKLKQRYIDSFVRINLLGNYVMFEWMYNMDKYTLMKLYYETKDVFMYRAMLTNDHLFAIFGQLDPFHHNIYIYEKFQILTIMIDIIDMILDRSQTQNDREHGILLFLTALTIVSNEASESLYYLAQNAGNFYHQ
jgi:hypothetical protein